ncbi:MAG: hypothetical protein PGN07_05210 [Aeromicrobium erythreum]
MRLLRTVVLPAAVVVLVAVVVALVVRGGEGALGAAVGGAVTLAFLGSSPGLLDPVARRSPAASLPVALAFFGLKAVAGVVLLALLLDPSGAGRHLDAPSLAATMVATALAWVALHVRALKRDRTPTYDLRNNP